MSARDVFMIEEDQGEFLPTPDISLKKQYHETGSSLSAGGRGVVLST